MLSVKISLIPEALTAATAVSHREGDTTRLSHSQITVDKGNVLTSKWFYKLSSTLCNPS